MGIDYIITRSCPVKETLGDYFLVLVKKRSRMLYLEHFKQNNPGFTEQTVFEEIEESSHGTCRNLTSMSIMREELAPLYEWQHQCADCAANFTYHAGGCWFYLPYPIPEVIEKLLMVTVQTLLEDEKNHKAAQFLHELPEEQKDAGIISGWRHNGLTELKESISFTWGHLFRKRTISSDNILDCIFDKNVLEGEQLTNITYFLEFLQKCTKNGMQKAQQDNEKIIEMSTYIQYQLQPYWQFIKACQIADELEEGILVIP